MLQNGKIGGGGRDGESQILNIFKYGRVVCQIEHTEKMYFFAYKDGIFSKI